MNAARKQSHSPSVTSITSVPSAASVASNSPTLPPALPVASFHVNFLHLELYHNLVSNSSKPVPFLENIPELQRMRILRHAFSAPFLMYQMLAISALHMYVSQPVKRITYYEESVKLQTEASRLFNDSLREVNSENIVPAFVFAAMFGTHFFCDAFLLPSYNVNEFLDRYIQSLRLFQGVRSIMHNRWHLIMNSDIGDLLGGVTPQARFLDDEISRGLEQLRLKICDSSGLDEIQLSACESASRQLGIAYATHARSSDHPPSLSMTEGAMLTAWSMAVSPAYIELLVQRKPEALLILAHFSVLLHVSREYWAIRNAGERLLESLGDLLGSEWEPWLSWPRSIIMLGR